MAWMKYWLMPVSSAQSTSFRISTTSSLPFIRTSARHPPSTRSYPASTMAQAGALASPGARAENRGMPEALDVTCPCCGSLLKVDPETGSVVWLDKKKAPAQDFDDL